MKTLSQELTKGYLAFLDHYSLPAYKKVNQEALSGQRKSGAKGSSMEFSDFREYMPGDDTRRIDWNSFARGDKLFTRVYFEEKQAEVNIFIDTSKSFSTYEEKSMYGKMLAAGIAYIALKNNDKVNIFGWNDGLKNWSMNSVSKNNFANIVKFLDGLAYEGGSNLKKTVDGAIRGRGNGMSFVISDMFIEDDIFLAIKGLKYKKQEIIAIQVLSKEEENPLEKGNLRLIDSENNEFKDIVITEGLIEEYKKELRKLKGAITDVVKKSGGKFVSLDTSVDLKEAIQLIFR